MGRKKERPAENPPDPSVPKPGTKKPWPGYPGPMPPGKDWLVNTPDPDATRRNA